MSTMFPRFIDALQHANLEMTAEEVAETLWLAHQMSLASGGVSASPEQDGNSLQPSDETFPPTDAKSPSRPAQAYQPSAKTEATSDIHLHLQKPTNKSAVYQGAMLARMPAAPALAESLALGRALRPLRRRHPSRKTFVLNERATVQQIAETRKRIWAPVVEPAPMRWFELALVIDEGASMIFWRQSIAELRTLFEQLGAFRDVRVWRLATDEKEQVQLYAGTQASAVQQPTRSPKELIDPTGRRLILVVTDCVSPAWYSGKVQEALKLWGQKNLVTLLQMFPRRLWPRTALCAAETVRISASAPGMANVRLKTPEARPWFSTELSIPMPVVTLEPKSLASWTRMVMGAESTRVSGVMFAKDVSRVFAETASMQENEDALTPQERIRNFWAAASPTAHKLAGLLSATPISLPIVHLIQQTMLHESTQVHVAEVFLGGLLKETYRNHTTAHPEYIEYEFLPEVREELLNALPMPDEYQVLREVSRFVGNHLGLSRDFLARVPTPNLSEELTIDQESRPFAKIAATVWRKLGGDYAKLANQLEKQLNEHDTQLIGSKDTGETITTTAQELLKEARAITDREARAQALIALLPHLSGMSQAEVIHEALETMHSIASNGSYIRAWLTHLPNVPEELKAEVIQEILEAARWVTNEEVRVEALADLLQHLPEAWKAEVVQQTLVATRIIANEELRSRLLRDLLEHSSEELKSRVEREIQSTQTIAAFYDSSSPTRECICPSCFEEIYIGECRVVSGRTPGKVLKEAPEGWWERRMARLNPERLDIPQYAQELAHRECPNCRYLLPSNIEHVKSITLAVIGDTFSGKSHYIAALIHQIKAEWMGNATGFARFTCLTPEVEKAYTRDYFEPLFLNKKIIDSTLQATKPTWEPLIYNLVVYPSPNHPTTVANLMIYDASGEDFAVEDRLVQFARFIFNASAFVFVADPVTMVPIFEQLPPQLQSELQSAFELAHAKIRRAVEGLNSVIDLFERYRGIPDGSSLPDTPIAVMLSKANLLKYIHLPYDYSFLINPQYGDSVDLQDIHIVDQEVRNLLRIYKQGDLLAATRRFEKVKFFATSATGEPPNESGYFTKVEPCRCLDPVLWILHQFGIIKTSV